VDIVFGTLAGRIGYESSTFDDVDETINQMFGLPNS